MKVIRALDPEGLLYYKVVEDTYTPSVEEEDMDELTEAKAVEEESDETVCPDCGNYISECSCEEEYEDDDWEDFEDEDED